MNNSKFTLCQFFGLDKITVTETQSASIESNEKAKQIKEKIAKEVKTVKWPAAFNEILKKIEEMSDVSMVYIMTAAWKKSGEILQKLEESTEEPDETVLVPLAKHTITSKHQPHIDVTANGKWIGRVGFDINIEITLKGIILNIQDGKIKAITTGSCEGKGGVKCEGVVIAEKELEPISLPEIIDLEDSVSHVS